MVKCQTFNLSLYLNNSHYKCAILQLKSQIKNKSSYTSMNICIKLSKIKENWKYIFNRKTFIEDMGEHLEELVAPTENPGSSFQYLCG